MPIIYAELFAVYAAFAWLRQSNTFRGTDIHFFVDNTFVRDSLCSTLIPKEFFFLIQDIKHIAHSIKCSRELYIHWIPSHIDKHTQGQFHISGNRAVDKLAEQAREQARDLLSTGQNVLSHESVRERILGESASLVWEISKLLRRDTNYNPSDSPSSDDFSSSNADQIILLDGL